MKIVVLDGYALNPGDLSWEDWKPLGELVVYDRTSPDELLSRAGDAEVLLTNKTVLGEADRGFAGAAIHRCAGYRL